MADSQLTVQLIAKIGNFQSELDGALGQLKKFAKEGDDTAKKFLGEKLPVASKSAAFALTNLGRVAQDAPFGFVAIQNNLIPLFESLGRFNEVAKETGQTIGSALVGALTGPAGLALALSAAVSAATIFFQIQQKNESEAKKAAKSTKDYVDTLDDLTKAQVKGAQNAQGEINQLTALYRLATNAAASTRERRKAVDELQSQYPEYFRNIKDEVILAGGAATAYDRLKESILAVAQARAAESILEKNQGRQIENTQKLTDLESERLKLNEKLTAAQKFAAELSKGLSGNTQSSLTGGGGQAFIALNATGKVEELQRQINDNIAKQNNLRTDSNILAGRNLSLIEKINKAAQQNGIAAITGSFTDQTNIPKVKAPKAPKREDIGFVPSSTPLTNVNNEDLVTDDDPYLTGAKNIRDYTEALLNKQQAEKKAQKTSQDYSANLEYNNHLLSQSASLIGNNLVDAFASMLAGGQNAFAAFGELILQLVARIAAATAAAALLAAIISVIPGFNVGGISQAAGFISNFGSISKSLGGIPQLATGAVVSGPTLALIGEGNESEVVAPLSKFDEMVSSRAGGNMQLTGRLVAKGGDLVAVINAEQKAAGRRGRG